ncbi:DExH-box ATP-dependent RNA helicase DExH6-like isoform X2 [Wolffia australiana]
MRLWNVPQYLLESMWSKGKNCKIVCTQPRRLSATSVAERISFERGENVGDNIGYKIRLESKGGRHSSIMFCTNGILLRMLIGNGVDFCRPMSKSKRSTSIFQLTHIIVDEIHERDRFSDFMLAIIKDLLPLYPHLRVILMSATLESERFSQYFGACPIIQVPGFTFPVKTFYLEDVLSILHSTDDNHLNSGISSGTEETELDEEYVSSLEEAIDLALFSDEFESLLELVALSPKPTIINYQHSTTGMSPLMVLAAGGRISDVCMLLSLGAQCDLRSKDGRTALDWAQQNNQDEVCDIIREHVLTKSSGSEADRQALIDNYLGKVNPEFIDARLIVILIRKICADSTEGAILVFLPGWDDISKTRDMLLDFPEFKDATKFSVLCLHSMIPSAEQKKVFQRPPPGARKIVFSTNIAETAITIDDVVFVIDSGRMKEKSYDPYNNVSTLLSSWVSKASMRQREGRAGRCQPGICYHLFTSTRAQSFLEYQVPEIKRMPIEELCLQVKMLDANCKIVEFLQKIMDPPVLEAISNGIMVLQDIGALTRDEQLTELGERLGTLPVHPSVGKMLLFAIIMNCLDPALTLACATNLREPFVIPMTPGLKKMVATAKATLASFYGGYSDQLATIAAFDFWQMAKVQGLGAKFCSMFFVSAGTMKMIKSMRGQLMNELVKNRFIPSHDISRFSFSSRDHGILRAVLVAGAYPMVGKLLPPARSSKRAVVETVNGTKVLLHPQSSNFELTFGKSVCKKPLYLIYDEITRLEGMMSIKNCTVVSPYSLLIMAAEIAVAPADDERETEKDRDVEISSASEDEGENAGPLKTSKDEKFMSSAETVVTLIVDRWLMFHSTAIDVAQIYCLKERLVAAILFKVKHPQNPLPPALEATVHALACILSWEAAVGMPLNNPTSKDNPNPTSKDNSNPTSKDSPKPASKDSPMPSSTETSKDDTFANFLTFLMSSSSHGVTGHTGRGGSFPSHRQGRLPARNDEPSKQPQNAALPESG